MDSFETGGPSEDGAKVRQRPLLLLYPSTVECLMRWWSVLWTQIVVQSFTVDEPPFHPPNEVFISKKASDDDD